VGGTIGAFTASCYRLHLIVRACYGACRHKKFGAKPLFWDATVQSVYALANDAAVSQVCVNHSGHDTIKLGTIPYPGYRFVDAVSSTSRLEDFVNTWASVDPADNKTQQYMFVNTESEPQSLLVSASELISSNSTCVQVISVCVLAC